MSATVEATKLVHLYEYSLSKSDLDKLPQDQRAALCVTCYAETELNALMKIYIHSIHEYFSVKALDSLAFSTQFVVARLISAKLFELAEFLELGGKKKKTSDETLLQLAETAISDFELLRHGDGYHLARQLRHEATSHYSLDAAIKNWSFVSDTANCTLYLHKARGNSFYPLGEEVMFIGRMNRYNNGTQRTDLGRGSPWFDWTLRATDWMRSTNHRFLNKLVFERFPERHVVKKVHWVEPDVVSEGASPLIPLFFKKQVE